VNYSVRSDYFIQWSRYTRWISIYIKWEQVNIERGVGRGGRKRDREEQISRERETECWRVLEMAWVVNLTIGIEHLSISINGLNISSIKKDINRYGGGHKICWTVPWLLFPLTKHHTTINFLCPTVQSWKTHFKSYIWC
jgi:hypothetical protein